MIIKSNVDVHLDVLSPNLPLPSNSTDSTNNHTSSPGRTVTQQNLPPIDDGRSPNDGCNAPPAPNTTTCSCLIPTAPPSRPSILL